MRRPIFTQEDLAAIQKARAEREVRRMRPVRADDYDPPLTEEQMVSCPDEFVIDDAPMCDFAGHEWADAGGGLLICAVCEAEKWA